MKNFLALVVFVLGIGAWFWYSTTKETREALREGREQLAGHEQLVAARELEFNTIVNALDLRGKVAAKQKELADIRTKQQALDKQIAALLLQKRRQVTVNRQVMVGTVLTNLTLNDGRKFPEARISKIDDISVSFTTPSGVIKVKPTDLSPEVREILQYK
jgi:hypothetical protein